MSMFGTRFNVNTTQLLFLQPSGCMNASVVGRGGGGGMDVGNIDMNSYSSSIYHSPPLSVNTTPRRALELENLSIAQLSSLAPVKIKFLVYV